MLRYRSFFWVVFAFVALILFYNLTVWHFFTAELLTRNEGEYTGDLARMGYLSGYTHKRQNTLDLTRSHLELSEYVGQPVDVVTIGDSFSQGGGSGPNRFYQDYIASNEDLSVLNVGYFLPGKNTFEVAIILLNSGYFDLVDPDYLVLEIVERNCYKFSGEIDFNATLPIEELHRAILKRQNNVKKSGQPSDLPDVGFLNTGNFKWALYNMLYLFSPNAFFSKTYKLELSKPFFTGEKSEELLVIDKSLAKIKKNDLNSTSGLNDNLNKLADRFEEKGISLYFMPAVDKYDLYSRYIKSNQFPESNFFELLRGLPRKYQLIDTKDILLRLLENGEKDVYWIDDTHWSWKASKAIFDEVRFQSLQ